MTLTGHSRIAGVIGWPVTHSRSPRLHGYWLRELGIDGAYIPLAVPPDRLDAALKGLPALGFRGANVTVPHKTAALAACDSLDRAARAIGAVNTIVVGADGTLAGSNTDAMGFLANLNQESGFVPTGKRAAVLGAGGAARAVAWALADAGAGAVTVVNRTLSRAEALAAEFGGPLVARPWPALAEVLATADLLVNATSLGMQGAAPLEVDLSPLGANTVVNDIVYSPLETDLLRQARGRGLAAVDGLGMLLHQAAPGFERWFGTRPAVTPALRSFVLQDLAP